MRGSSSRNNEPAREPSASRASRSALARIAAKSRPRASAGTGESRFSVEKISRPSGSIRLAPAALSCRRETLKPSCFALAAASEQRKAYSERLVRAGRIGHRPRAAGSSDRCCKGRTSRPPGSRAAGRTALQARPGSGREVLGVEQPRAGEARVAADSRGKWLRSVGLRLACRGLAVAAHADTSIMAANAAMQLRTQQGVDQTVNLERLGAARGARACARSHPGNPPARRDASRAETPSDRRRPARADSFQLEGCSVLQLHLGHVPSSIAVPRAPMISMRSGSPGTLLVVACTVPRAPASSAAPRTPDPRFPCGAPA